MRVPVLEYLSSSRATGLSPKPLRPINTYGIRKCGDPPAQQRLLFSRLLFSLLSTSPNKNRNPNHRINFVSHRDILRTNQRLSQHHHHHRHLLQTNVSLDKGTILIHVPPVGERGEGKPRRLAWAQGRPRTGPWLCSSKSARKDTMITQRVGFINKLLK